MKSSHEINEEILAHVESIGGGYVWEPECFAVTLMNVVASDSDVSRLHELCGVQQIALNAQQLSFKALERVASTQGLESLVLCNASPSDAELSILRQRCPEVLFVAAKA